jgi:hypothetical protein
MVFTGFGNEDKEQLLKTARKPYCIPGEEQNTTAGHGAVSGLGKDMTISRLV